MRRIPRSKVFAGREPCLHERHRLRSVEVDTLQQRRYLSLCGLGDAVRGTAQLRLQQA
jgi:hypothetical protein